MQSRLVDFHCHLDLYRDYETVYEKCRRDQTELLAVTTTPRAWAKNLELAATSPYIRVALGLHPQLVAEGIDELELFRKLLPKTKYVGEVGLDASPTCYRSFEVQKKVFEGVLRACAEEGGKILSLHSVRCVGQVLKMLESFLPRTHGKVVFHWFTGSASEARRAAQYGSYFSINFEMLAGEKRGLIASLPNERLLTETDGPFTTTGGIPSLPGDVSLTIKALAEILKMDTEAVKSLIHENLKRLESKTAR